MLGTSRGALDDIVDDLVDAVTAPVVVFDRTARCLAANTAAADAFGVARDLLIGLDVRAVIADRAVLAEIDRMHADVFVAGRHTSAHLHIVGHARAAFSLNARVRPLRLGDDTVAVATLHEVETSNLAAEGLRLARELQGDVLGVLPIPVLVAHDGEIVFANPAALDLFGVPTLGALQARERTREHVVPEEVAEIERRRRARELGEPLPRSVEYHLVRPDGSRRVVDWATLHVNFGGRPAHLYAVTDLTDITGARDVLARSEAQQRAILSSLAEGVLVLDAEGRCVSANPAAALLLRTGPEQLVGATVEALQLLDPATRVPIAAADHPGRRALDGIASDRTAVAVRLRGGVRVFQVSARPLSAAACGPTGAVITFTDVTEQLRAAEDLAMNEERYRNLTELAPVGIFETDPDGRCRFVNAHWCGLTGLSEEEAMGDGWSRAIDEASRDDTRQRWHDARQAATLFSAELVFRRPDGTLRSTLCIAQPLRDPADGTLTGWLGTVTDVTEQHHVRDHLHALAHRDSLTGLLNRRALLAALDEHAATGREFAIVFCDLDGFKAINDRHGHDAGDTVLVEIAERFRAAARQDDLVARFAGDEFVLLVATDRADAIAQRLIDAARLPIRLESGAAVSISASVGAVTVARTDAPRHGSCAQAILRAADRAMYASKSHGKDRATVIAQATVQPS